MNTEVLEHNLHLLSGTQVTVVRPGFGTQSDSWTGIIRSQTEDWPIKFLFATPNIQILFQVSDVLEIETGIRIDGSNTIAIIRLKGPADYAPRVGNTATA